MYGLAKTIGYSAMPNVNKDPLAGLSGWEKQQLILQPPTWSERWRMSEPFMGKEQRRELVLTILLERREAYDKAFAEKVQEATRRRAERRYQDGEQALTDFKWLSGTALRAAQEQRHRDRHEGAYRDLVEQRRHERDHGHANERER